MDMAQFKEQVILSRGFELVLTMNTLRIAPIPTRMVCAISTLETVVLARDIAPYPPIPSRISILDRTLIQRTLRLLNENGFLFSFQ